MGRGRSPNGRHFGSGPAQLSLTALSGGVAAAGLQKCYNAFVEISAPMAVLLDLHPLPRCAWAAAPLPGRPNEPEDVPDSVQKWLEHRPPHFAPKDTWAACTVVVFPTADEKIAKAVVDALKPHVGRVILCADPGSWLEAYPWMEDLRPCP